MLDGIGLPTSSRLRENEGDASSGMFRDPPTGLADGLGLGLSYGATAPIRPTCFSGPPHSAF